MKRLHSFEYSMVSVISKIVKSVNNNDPSVEEVTSFCFTLGKFYKIFNFLICKPN